MRRIWTGAALGAVGCLTAGALAQSFNVDIGRIGYSWEEGVLPPSAAFGGAAGQPGEWNEVGTVWTATVPLVGLDGAQTNVTLTRSLFGVIESRPTFSTTGDCEALLDDAQVSSSPLT